MKIIKLGLLLGCCWFVVMGAVVSAQETGEIAKREVKKYFPGDFVNIIVSAPLDTTRITSILPNRDRVELLHDRRAKIWHGLWQVPIGFPAGSYTAVLEAKDLEGNTFSGETVPFIIGELTLITMIKKAPTPEAENKAEKSRRLAIETAQLAEKAKPAPLREKVKITPWPKKVKKTIPARKKQAAKNKQMAKIKQMNFVEVKRKKDLNVTKTKLVAFTRYYMEKMEFDKVRASLKALIRTDPANQGYRKMLRRVEAVIKTEKEKNK